MKRYLPLIFIVLIVILAGAMLCGHTVHAQVPAGAANAAPAAPPAAPEVPDEGVSLWGYSLTDAVNELLANFMNAVLGATSWVVYIAAALLNVSLVITLHIKDFVDNTPAIYATWQTIRDISSLFFIFFLLYAALQMIVSGGGASYGQLVKNIVIAGILINFSFFFTSVLIDVSNVTSQAIYNSMLPGYEKVKISDTTNLNAITTAVTSGRQTEKGIQGGLADIFMNSLQITRLYDPKTKGTQGIGPLKIIFIGVVGILIMITAAVSFTLAAAAFIIRLAILLFLLAFSPIYYAAMVIPQLKEHAQTFTKVLKSQLLFMPVYLLLMYAALAILNNSKIINAANVQTISSNVGADWAFGYVVLAINFGIVIVMLNLPLFVGLKMGGMASSVLKLDKWGADKIFRAGWSNTGGRAASIIARSDTARSVASWVPGGKIAMTGLRGVAGDYNKRLEASIKAKTEFAESLGYNQAEVNKAEQQLRAMRIAKAPAADLIAQEKVIADIKSRRKERFAKTMTTPWMKVARSNKKAATKINLDVWEAQLKEHKDNLKDVSNELKQLNQSIDALHSAKQTPEQAQLDRQKDLGEREKALRTEVNNMQDKIAQAKLVL